MCIDYYLNRRDIKKKICLYWNSIQFFKTSKTIGGWKIRTCAHEILYRQQKINHGKLAIYSKKSFWEKMFRLKKQRNKGSTAEIWL